MTAVKLKNFKSVGTLLSTTSSRKLLKNKNIVLPKSGDSVPIRFVLSDYPGIRGASKGHSIQPEKPWIPFESCGTLDHDFSRVPWGGGPDAPKPDHMGRSTQHEPGRG